MKNYAQVPYKKKISQRETANMSLNSEESCEIGPTDARERRQEAFQVRQRAAIFQKDLPVLGHQCNGDEDIYANKIGNYSRGYRIIGWEKLTSMPTRPSLLP